ncbi:carbohydrate kinase family protein [Streptomyces chryseus]|uniref:carbohydrate kinase family protein n=1 Tax=Streptomyces chryseus TaxID=68186 RepID=UPI00110F876F|nr:carbohydrate kinase family protein [Streptomyces chryseus]GGX44566.1 kinase [Streptomyces chryseus]
MRIAVSGSIATDHLMVFPGRFADQLISEMVERVSLSFLADKLEVRRGGVGANISFGLGRLGLRPVLVGAAGVDFSEYGSLLRESGVDTSSVRVSETLHTARFVCTTDIDQNQIATFYAGAMAEAHRIDLAEAHHRADGFDLVIVGADDPAAMLRHTATAHALGMLVAADPSQQLARLDTEQTRSLVDGAHLLFTNEYESALLRERTAWTEEDVLVRVGTWITTRGADGVSIATADGPPLDIAAVPTNDAVDPTGVGDAFRAGFLAGLSWRLSYERAAQLGCTLATVVLESVGTQEYKLLSADLLARISRVYGHEAAREIEPRLS